MRGQEILATAGDGKLAWLEFSQNRDIVVESGISRGLTTTLPSLYNALGSNMLRVIEEKFGIIKAVEETAAKNRLEVRVGMVNSAPVTTLREMRRTLVSWEVFSKKNMDKVRFHTELYKGGEDRVLDQYQEQASLYSNAIFALKQIISAMEKLNTDVVQLHEILDKAATFTTDAERLNFLKSYRDCAAVH